MPIYDYRCEACGHEFEELRSFSDDDPESCPECGSESPRRLISGGNFQLKGGGWYETEYGKKATSKSSGTSGESSERSSEDSSGDESDSTSSASTPDEAA